MVPVASEASINAVAQAARHRSQANASDKGGPAQPFAQFLPDDPAPEPATAQSPADPPKLQAANSARESNGANHADASQKPQRPDASFKPKVGPHHAAKNSDETKDQADPTETTSLIDAVTTTPADPTTADQAQPTADAPQAPSLIAQVAAAILPVTQQQPADPAVPAQVPVAIPALTATGAVAATASSAGSDAPASTGPSLVVNAAAANAAKSADAASAPKAAGPTVAKAAITLNGSATNAASSDPDQSQAASPAAGDPKAPDFGKPAAHAEHIDSDAKATSHPAQLQPADLRVDARPAGDAGQAPAPAPQDTSANPTLPQPGQASVAGQPMPVTANSAAPLPPASLVPVNGLAVEIAARAQSGSNRFDIRLDPPELGRIDVRLHVDSQGRVTSHLVVDRADTLAMLRRDASDLEQSLQQAGLKTSDNSLQFSLRDQSFGGAPNGGDRSGMARLVIPQSDPVPADAPLRNYARGLGLGGGVDIRV